MTVVFDSTFLLLLLDKNAPAPNDLCRPRLEHLLQKFEKDRTRIIIPTPVLAEVLVHAGRSGPEYLTTLGRSSRFQIADFDQRAAIECAAAIHAAIIKGDKRSGLTITAAKIKFDRQIIAIALVNKATAIYSSDSDIASLAKNDSIAVYDFSDLALPPEDAQPQMKF